MMLPVSSIPLTEIDFSPLQSGLFFDLTSRNHPQSIKCYDATFQAIIHLI